MSLNCIVIDDSLFIRETMQSIIEEAGYTLTAKFASGSEVLNNIAQYNPDVIFCDIILPEMTGLDLLNLLTEGFPNAKILMLSGVTQGEAISAALRLGAVDFIHKPIDRNRVISLLDKISEDELFPTVESLTVSGIACSILTGFLQELIAHSAATFRKVIETQSRSILEDLADNSGGRLVVDPNFIQIEPVPHEEDEDGTQIIRKLVTIPRDLQFELEFLYSSDVIKGLFDRTLMTMGSKKQYQMLFEKLPPDTIGLPSLPEYTEPTIALSNQAGTTYLELDNSLSIALFLLGVAGPGLIECINIELLTEIDLMKNSNNYYSLIGDDHEPLQEGLVGPLPVSSEKSALISSMAYIFRKLDKQGHQQTLIAPIFFTPRAEKLVSDMDKINSLIAARIASVEYVENLDRLLLRGIIDDIIDYILGD